MVLLRSTGVSKKAASKQTGIAGGVSKSTASHLSKCGRPRAEDPMSHGSHTGSAEPVFKAVLATLGVEVPSGKKKAESVVRPVLEGLLQQLDHEDGCASAVPVAALSLPNVTVKMEMEEEKTQLGVPGADHSPSHALTHDTAAPTRGTSPAHSADVAMALEGTGTSLAPPIVNAHIAWPNATKELLKQCLAVLAKREERNVERLRRKNLGITGKSEDGKSRNSWSTSDGEPFWALITKLQLTESKLELPLAVKAAQDPPAVDEIVRFEHALHAEQDKRAHATLKKEALEVENARLAAELASTQVALRAANQRAVDMEGLKGENASLRRQLDLAFSVGSSTTALIDEVDALSEEDMEMFDLSDVQMMWQDVREASP